MRHVFFLMLVFLTVVVSVSAFAGGEVSPQSAIVLDTHQDWRATSWQNELGPAKNFGVETHPDFVRFMVKDPSSVRVWIHYLKLPIDFNRYPIAVLKYRAENYKIYPRHYLIWMDDGKGPDHGGKHIFRLEDIQADGQVHELRTDIRTLKPAGVLTGMAVMVSCGEKAPAILDIFSLNFEADPKAPATRPATAESPIAFEIVDSDGKGVADAKIVLDAERKNFAVTGKTDAAGKVAISPIANESGKHMVRVEKEGLFTVEQAVEKSAGGAPIRVTLSPALQLRGTVRDEKGQPIANVSITGHWSERNRSCNTKFGSISTSTDKNGQWQGPPMPSENVYINFLFTHPDYADETVRLTVQKKQPPIDVVLKPGSMLEILVTGESDNKPVPMAQVEMRRLSDGHRFVENTNNEGVIRKKLSFGDYSIERVYCWQGGAAGKMVNEKVTVRKGETTHFAIKLAGKPKIAGTVLDPDGKPAADASVVVMPSGRESVNTDAKGKFTCSYDASEWGGSQSMQQILLARDEKRNLAAALYLEDEQKTAEIKLAPGLTVAGKIVDPNGKPIEKAFVSIMLRAGRWGSTIPQPSNQTGSDGRYKIVALPVDEKLSVYVSGGDNYGQADQEIDAKSAKAGLVEMKPITLEFANLTVSGRVVDADDKPVAGVQVQVQGENQPYRNTSTDSDGKFTIKGVCKGPMRVFAYQQDGGSYGNSQASGGDKDIEIVLRSRNAMGPMVPQQKSLLGKPLPKLERLNLSIKADELKGKKLLLVFYDPMSRPSRHAVKKIEAMPLAEKGVMLLKVDATKLNEKAKQTFGLRSLPWLILTDETQKVTSAGFKPDDLPARLR